MVFTISCPLPSGDPDRYVCVPPGTHKRRSSVQGSQLSPFLYNDAWQSCALNDGYHEGFEFLLKAGENTGSSKFRVKWLTSFEDFRQPCHPQRSYLKILMITGASPDAYRDYNFGRLIPETIMAMADEAKVIREIANNLAEINKGRARTSRRSIPSQTLSSAVGREDELAKNPETSNLT